MSPTEIIFWFFYIGGTIGSIINPLYGTFLYILVYNLNPETQWWGKNVLALEIRTSFTVALAIAIGAIVKWGRMRRAESQFPMMFVLMLAFLAYETFAMVAGLQGVNQSSWYYIEKLLKVGVYIFMMIRLIRSADDFKFLLWAWLVGTLYIGYQAWGGVGEEISGRLTGGLGGPDFGESSGLSAHLVGMLGIVGFLYYTSNSKILKLLTLWTAALAVNAIIMTRTRNALPGIIVMVVFAMLRLPRGLRIKCLVGIAIGLASAFQLADDGWWRRMETMKEPEKDASIIQRYEYWDAAVGMAHDNPWGVGPGRFRDLSSQYMKGLVASRSAHSTYYECLAETGYPGILLFLLCIGSAFWHYESARAVGKRWVEMYRKHPDLALELRQTLLMATAVEVSLAGYLTSAMFTTRLWTEGLWLLLSMSCCMHNIAKKLRNQVRKARQSVLAEANPVRAASPGRGNVLLPA